MKVAQSMLAGLALLFAPNGPANAAQDALPSADYIPQSLRCQGIYQQIKDMAAGRQLKPEIEQGLADFKAFHALLDKRGEFTGKKQEQYITEGRNIFTRAYNQGNAQAVARYMDICRKKLDALFVR